MAIGENKESLDPHAEPLSVFSEKERQPQSFRILAQIVMFQVMRHLLAPNQIKNCFKSKTDRYWFVKNHENQKNSCF
jgi:hypothetical protein